MQYLKVFILSEGTRYRDLEPCTDRLSPNRSGMPGGWSGWAYGAGTAKGDLFLLYFEQACPRAILARARPNGIYKAQWFNPRSGQWSDAGSIAADATGRASLPSFPGGAAPSETDWALKLTLVGEPG